MEKYKLLYLNPNQAIELSKDYFNEIFKESFLQRKEIIAKYKNVKLTETDLEGLRKFFEIHTLISFTPIQIEEMFESFPYERAYLIDAGTDNISSSDVTECLMSMVSQFFMHCDWPKMKDNVDMLAWADAITSVASKLEYEIASEELTLHSEDIYHRAAM